MKKPHKFILPVILAAATLTVMAGTIIAPVLNLIRDGLSIDRTSAGLIISTHGLFVALSSPFAGMIIDKTGCRIPFTAGLILYGIAGGAGLFINSFYPMIISRVFLGIAIALIANSISVMILNLYKNEVNKIMGWRGCASSFGGIIWPLVGGALGAISWRSPFAVYTAGIFLGIIALITIPEIRPEKEEYKAEKNSVLNILKNNKIIFAVYGLIFLAMTFLYNTVIFLPQILEKINISHPFYISIFLSLSMLSSGLASVFYDRIKALLSYKKIILIIMALWSTAFFIICRTNSHYIIGLSVTLFGLGMGTIFPAGIIWTGQLVPPSFRGRIISYLRSCSFMGQFFSPILFSPIALKYSLHHVFMVSGGISLIVFILFLFFYKENKEE